MKKIVSLALAMLLVLSLAACGSKNSGAGDVSDALTLLNTVWATYSEEEKFPVSGGDYDHPVDDAPGAFDISNADNMDYMLGFPGPSVANLVDAASLMHMMNANTFTCGAYHLSDDDDVSAADVASSLRDNIMNRQWMCGFPDKLVVLTMGQFVVSVYGAEDLVDTFRDKLQNCFSSAVVVYDDPIA